MSQHWIFSLLHPLETLFRPRQARTLKALGPALYPRSPEDLKKWAEDLEVFIEGTPPAQRLALRASVLFLELSPFLLQIGPNQAYWASRSFSGLPPRERERILRRLDSHYSPALRSLWKLLRVVGHFVYFGDRTRARIYGFDPHERRQRADRLKQTAPITSRRRSHPPKTIPNKASEPEASL